MAAIFVMSASPSVTTSLEHREQSEVAYNRYLLSKALERIVKNPILFLAATALRFVQFWLVNPRVGSETFLRLAYFGPFLLLAFYGIYCIRKRHWQLAPIFLFLLVYPLPFYVIHVDRGRYTYPVEPFVLLLAAAAVAVWYRRKVRRNLTANIASDSIAEMNTDTIRGVEDRLGN